MGLDVTEVNGFNAEGEGDFAGSEKGTLGRGIGISELITREEAAEVERDILKAIVCQPGA